MRTVIDDGRYDKDINCKILKFIVREADPEVDDP